MRIEWKSAEDRVRVWNGYRRAGAQRQTLQLDRYNVILLLGDGGPDGEELDREQIASVTGRSRQFVDEWAGDIGGAGLTPSCRARPGVSCPDSRPSRISNSKRCSTPG